MYPPGTSSQAATPPGQGPQHSLQVNPDLKFPDQLAMTSESVYHCQLQHPLFQLLTSTLQLLPRNFQQFLLSLEHCYLAVTDSGSGVEQSGHHGLGEVSRKE